MATSRKSERHTLTSDEFDLVQQTHYPALSELETDEFTKVIKLVRERRDRVRTQANDRRRDLRRQGHGRTTTAEGERGLTRRASILGEAVTRLNNEHARRNAKKRLQQSARQALDLKRSSATGKNPASGTTASRGMKRKENAKTADIGSPMHKGRVSQAGKVAQAKKDDR